MVVFLWGRSDSCRRDIYIVTTLASVLVVAEYWTDRAPLGDFLVNYLLYILLLWGVAWVLAERHAKLQASEQRFAKIFRANPGGIVITRQADGLILEINDAGLALSGYTREQLVGRTGVELGILPAESRAPMRAAFHAQGYLRDLDIQLINARGEPADILYSAEEIEFNGEPAYLGLIVDVTERKRLAARADHLAALVDAAGDAITSCELDGKILTMNSSAEALYGISAAATIGQNIATIAPPDLLDFMREMMGRVVGGESVMQDDVPWQRPDGSTRTLSLSLAPVRNHAGQVTALSAIARDITARKQLEEATAQLAAIVDSSSDAIVSTDLQGRVVSWNPSAEQLYDCSASQALGRPINEVLPPDQGSDEIAILARVRRGEKVPLADRIWTKPDGATVDLSIVLSPVNNTRGALIGMASIARDITARKQLEDKLVASERKYRDLYDNSPDMYLVTVPAQGLILDCNQTLARTLGYSIEELIGGPSCALFTPASYTQMQAARDELLAPGTSGSLEVQLRHRDGTPLDALMAVTIEDDPAGGPARASVTLHDITTRKAAERTLRASEERFTKLFHSSPVGISLSRLADGLYQEVNAAFEAMLGYTRAELIGHTSLELGIVRSEDRAHLITALRNQGHTRGLDLVLRTKRGDYLDTLFAIEIAEIGGEEWLISSVVDITARKAAERERLFLSALVASSPEAVIGRAIDGTILSWNRGAEQLFGYTAEEAIGQNLTMLAAPDGLAQLQEIMAEVAQGHDVEGIETRRMAKDSRVFDCQVSSFPVRDGSGAIIGVASFTHDITERKAAERALRGSEERFARLFNSSPVGLTLTRLADGLYQEVNDAFLALIGCSRAEVIGRTSLELGIISPEDRRRLGAELRGQGSLHGTDLVLHTKRGELLNTLFSIDLVDFGGESYVLFSVVDITRRRQLEAALAASERKYRDLYDNSPDMYFVGLPAQGLVLDCNHTLARTLGYTPEELIGGPSSVVYAPATYAQLQADRAELMDTGKYRNDAAQLRRRDGTLLDVIMAVTLEHDPAGGPARARVTLHDITERKRLEAELRYSEQKWRSVFEFLPVGLSVVDGKDKVTDSNPALAQLLGLTPEGVREGSYAQRRYFHADMSPMAFDEFPSQRALREGQVVRDVVIGVEKEDGELIWVSTSATPESIEGLALTVSIDITARKQIEEALAESERKFRDLYDNSPDMYVSGYSNGTFRDCNLTAARKLGYTPEELMAQPTSTIFTPASYSRVVAELPKHLAAEAWDNFEVQLQCKDGTVLDALLSVQFEPATADHLAYSRVTLHDITERKRADAERLALAERWKMAAQVSSIGVWDWRAGSDEVLWDERMYQIYGLAPGTAMDFALWRTLIHPDDRTDVEANNRKLGVERTWTPLEYRVVLPDGSLRYLLATGGGFYDAAGTPVRQLGISMDITERKRAEAALAASEARLRAVIENTDDTVWSVDRDYCFLVGNSVFAHGVQRVIGRPLAAGECVITEPFPDGARALWQPLYDRALAGESFTVQIPSTLSPGGTLACHLHPIYAADGSIHGVTGRAADITALKQAEARLREAYQRLQLATDAAGIGIWNWNFADGRLDWDDRMCELYAVTAAERTIGIFYDLWRARVHPDDLALAEPTQGDPNRLGSEFAQTYRILLPDGAVRYIQASSVMEYDQEGNPRRMVGVNRDVTDQRHYEQLLQDTNAVLEEHVAARTAELRTALSELQRASRLKDEFMAMISHELRTPLTGVLSMSEMLEDQVAGPLNDRQASYVKNITQSGERLLAVINGILSYTHLLSGKVQLHPELCELANLLNVCAVSQQHKAAAKSQTIAVAVAPFGLAIIADATALAEVIKRLLDNAFKFTPDSGRIGLEARLGSVPRTVDLVVWDTGIGIAADQFDYVFHAFTQVDARLARSHEGIGIGLAYVDEMVRLMGGTIRLESTPGEGSRFTVTLPEGRS